jgi:pSer/pThr/pTyr-binding forkhead associated (FHA) protein
VPESVPLAHLRRMPIRDPHLIAETQGGVVAVAIPDRARWTVGRDEASDLQIDWDPSVSRLHAALERIGDLLVLEDSGVSRNGTFVNGRRAVGRTRLHDLAEITLGETTLLVRLPGAEAASAATVTIGRPSSAPSSVDLTAAESRVVRALIETRSDPAAPIPTNREIAAALEVGPETVKSHLKAVARKLAAQGVRGPIDRMRLAELAAQGVLALRGSDASPGADADG